MPHNRKTEELLPATPADRGTRRRLTRTKEQETIIINRSGRSTHPEEKSVRTSGATPCGRTLPPGLDYLDSRVDLDLSRCFQLMRTADPALIESWIGAGNDLLEFEVIPVQGSADASRAADAGR